MIVVRSVVVIQQGTIGVVLNVGRVEAIRDPGLVISKDSENATVGAPMDWHPRRMTLRYQAHSI